MKIKTKPGLFGILIMLSVIVGGTACTNNSESTSSSKTTDTMSKKEVVYYCPMKCEGDKTYDEPGQCPECGMDLKKKEGTAEKK